MKLLELHINGFGKFHDRTVKFGDGINIIYGKNEAGKSTLHTFIRGMLFGIERGRGRAAKNDLYSKYEPWENSGIYEGWLRVESEGVVYRIERKFRKDDKALTIVNETRGLPEEPTKELMDKILGGLNETVYNNTISIGQLKSATEDGMIGELRNYIANMNTTGSVSLNITKASAFLRNQRRTLETSLSPDASREYTSLLGEIRKLDAEISSPEYENQLSAYQAKRSEIRKKIESTQSEKDALNDMVSKGKTVLNENHLPDQAAIDQCIRTCDEYYASYEISQTEASKKSRFLLAILSFVLMTGCIGGAAVFGIINFRQFLPLCAVLGGAAVILFILGLAWLHKNARWKRTFKGDSEKLSELFNEYLGDATVSPEAVRSFHEYMDQLTRLCSSVVRSEEEIRQYMENINELQEKQNSYSEQIEQQQKSQWDLERKLDYLNNCRIKAASLKHVLAENDRIREEISAIELAEETMQDLSMTIRDSFGFYLNQEASRLIAGITGGIYDSMSVDENLNIYLNTKTKLIPLDQLSSGTVDQVYLALRLAAAKLFQNGGESYPLVFDDSFAQYDDDRLRSVLGWLSGLYDGQMIIFSCHRREMDFLKSKEIPFELIEI